MDFRERDLFLYIIVCTFLKVGIDAYTMEENSIAGLAAKDLMDEQENRSVRVYSYLFPLCLDLSSWVLV